MIGEAILQTHHNIKTVLAKQATSAVSSVFATTTSSQVNTKPKQSTANSAAYHVDVAKAYFSPRLSHEHERVASLVQSGEVVTDLFSGVGPFSVLIGKSLSWQRSMGLT